MNNEEVIEIIKKIIEKIEIAPSSFIEEYGIDTTKIKNIPIDKAYGIIIRVLKEEAKEFDFTVENVKKILEQDINIQYKTILIAATEDKEYIKQVVIKDKDMIEGFKTDLIIFIDDKEFTEKCINTLELTPKSKYKLIEKMDTEYIKNYLKKERLKLPLYQIINFVAATKDSEYIQKFIRKNEKYLTNRTVMKLILATNDAQYIDKCIRGEECRLTDFNKIKAIKKIANLLKKPDIIKTYINELGSELDEKAVITLYLLTDDKNYIEEHLSTNTKQLLRETVTPITLPPQITVGIEIESIGIYGNALQDTIIQDWPVKEDSSINDYDGTDLDGIEIVSPILTSDMQMEQQINTICTLLKTIGQKTNKSTGGHIHIGANYLSTADSITNFLYLIENSEDILYVLSNGEGSIPRDRYRFYAEPFTYVLSNAIETELVDLTVDGKDELIEELKKIQGKDRYIGVSFYYLNQKRNTIEFRMPNGTLDPKQWIENINLFGGLVKTAEDIMIIQSKNEGELNEEEEKKLKLFNSLPMLTDEERLKALLDLTIKGEKTDYLMRYYINRELINQHDRISFDNSFVIKKGMIKPKNIGRMVFTGSDAVRGEEIVKMEEQLAREESLKKDSEVIDM